MIQRDYLLRVIEQASVVIMNIIFHKEIGNHAQALVEIDSAYGKLLNLDPNHIRQMTEDEIIEMLSSEGRIDAEKAIVIAELLREEAEIQELEADFNDNVFIIYIKSFCLYIEAIKDDSRYNRQEYFQKTDGIVQKITQYELPPHLQLKLLRYYELIGLFSKADDLLYELINVEDSTILAEGKSFYIRLLDKSDNDLLSGNLPRDEVQEGLAQIEKMLIQFGTA